MTKFPRLTLATLLMGSLALPAFALDPASPKDASATATHAPGKPGQLTSGMHKVAATGDAPTAKAPVAGVPSKAAKAKDSAAKPQSPAPVTKTN